MQLRYSDETIFNFRQRENPKAWACHQAGGKFSESFKGMVRQIARQTNVPAAMEFANVVLAGHGVEYVTDKRDQKDFSRPHGLSYINMGDVYVTTVVHDHSSGRFYWSTLGDVIEKQSQRFAGD